VRGLFPSVVFYRSGFFGTIGRAFGEGARSGILLIITSGRCSLRVSAGFQAGVLLARAYFLLFLRLEEDAGFFCKVIDQFLQWCDLEGGYFPLFLNSRFEFRSFEKPHMFLVGAFSFYD